MGTIVYGSCVEPGGMGLDNSSSEGKCPDCKAAGAVFQYWESCHSGAINNHWSGLRRLDPRYARPSM
jgi:hypothetical protein